MATAYDVVTNFKAKDSMSRVLMKMSNNTRKFSRNAVATADRATRAYNKLGKSLGGVNSQMKTGLGLAGLFSTGMLVSEGATRAVDFDKNISSAVAKFGTLENGSIKILSRNSKEYANIVSNVDAIAKKSIFTRSEVSEGLAKLASTGLSVDKSLTSLDFLTSAGTAMQSSIIETTNLITEQGQAFGFLNKNQNAEEYAKNLKKVGAAMVFMQSKTQFASVEELQTTMGQSAGLFKAMSGLGSDNDEVFKDYLSLISSVRATGVDPSVVGTVVKNAKKVLNAPTSKGGKALDFLGIKNSKNGELKSTLSIIQEVLKELPKFSKATQAKVAFDIFGVRGIPALSSIFLSGKDSLIKFRKEIDSFMNNPNGVKAMADFMKGGLWGTLKLTESALEDVSGAIVTGFQPEILKAITYIKQSATSIGDWIKENKSLLKTLLKISIALLKTYIVIKILITAFSVYKGVLMAMEIASIILAGEIGLLIAAIAIIALMIYYWDDLTSTFGGALIIVGLLTSAIWLLNFAFAANPIGLVVYAIGALVAIVALAIYKWEEWGAAVLLITGPLGIVLNFLILITKRWDKITNAFSTEGFLGGIKELGRVLLESVLIPLQQIYELIGNEKVLKSIEDLKIATGIEQSTNVTSQMSKKDEERIRLEVEDIQKILKLDEDNSTIMPQIKPFF